MLVTPGLSGDTVVEMSERIDPGLIFGVTVGPANPTNIYDHDLFVEVGISADPFSYSNITHLFISDFVSFHHPVSWSGAFYLENVSHLFLRASGNNNPQIRVIVSKISFARSEQLGRLFNAIIRSA